MKKTVQFCTNEFISGSVSADFDNTLFEISFTPLKPISKSQVYRAYFLDTNSNNLISIGVIETTPESGFLKVKNDFWKSTVVIMLKDTETENLKYVASAFFDTAWDVKGYLDPSEKNLELIKICKKINEELKFYEKKDSFFKITNFKPVSSLSAVKYALYEKSVMYSFDKYGYYLFSFEKNIITIGIIPVSDENPLKHLEEFSFLKNGIYYVKIMLDDDGQYFIKD